MHLSFNTFYPRKWNVILGMSLVAATRCFNLELWYIVEVGILNRVSSGTVHGGQLVCRVRTPFCRSPFGGRAYAAGRKFVRPCSIIFNPERAGLQNSLTRLVSGDQTCISSLPRSQRAGLSLSIGSERCKITDQISPRFRLRFIVIFENNRIL